MQYLSMLTQSYMVFNFRISLSTILPVSDSSITEGEHSSPLRKNLPSLITLLSLTLYYRGRTQFAPTISIFLNCSAEILSDYSLYIHKFHRNHVDYEQHDHKMISAI